MKTTMARRPDAPAPPLIRQAKGKFFSGTFPKPWASSVGECAPFDDDDASCSVCIYFLTAAIQLMESSQRAEAK
jgi:hypothetical protein